MSWRTTRRLRQLTQAAALLFFLYLAFATFQHVVPGAAANVYFRFDPLVGLGSMLASRAWVWAFAPALATVVATVLLGRVWCGWICPMGTVLEYVRFGRAKARSRHIPPRLRLLKYAILVAIVAGAVFGSLWLLVLDPITIAQRTVTASVIPGIDYVVRGFESALAHAGVSSGIIEWIDNSVRGHLLPSVTPAFAQAIALALLFLGIVALNLFADRFWCRYLCPLGALLGLLSKFAVLRPVMAETCTSCSRCASSCRLGAIDSGVATATGAGKPAGATPTLAVVTSECTMCLDCFVACPTEQGLRLTPRAQAGPWRDYDPARRELLAGAAAGIGAVVLLGTGWWQKVAPAKAIRPPGVHDEAAFLSACARCGECLDVCPTSGLQPALGDAGLAGLWTPVLKPRTGYCAWQCTACGEVCPTGAIPRLRLGAKRREVLGTAVIDRNRCLPWSQGKACVVCQEVCPVPKNAISLSGGKLVDLPDGSKSYIVFPTVLADRCVGCGLCEHQCPVTGDAAIQVWPASGAPQAKKSQAPG